MQRLAGAVAGVLCVIVGSVPVVAAAATTTEGVDGEPAVMVRTPMVEDDASDHRSAPSGCAPGQTAYFTITGANGSVVGPNVPVRDNGTAFHTFSAQSRRHRRLHGVGQAAPVRRPHLPQDRGHRGARRQRLQHRPERRGRAAIGLQAARLPRRSDPSRRARTRDPRTTTTTEPEVTTTTEEATTTTEGDDHHGRSNHDDRTGHDDHPGSNDHDRGSDHDDGRGDHHHDPRHHDDRRTHAAAVPERRRGVRSGPAAGGTSRHRHHGHHDAGRRPADDDPRHHHDREQATQARRRLRQPDHRRDGGRQHGRAAARQPGGQPG